MKKCRAVPAVVLTAVLLTGCSSTFAVEQSTVKLDENGSLQTAVIEELDKNYYDAEELQTLIEDSVAEYNEENGEESIVVQTFEVSEDGTAVLYLDYETQEDYRAFNHVVFYAEDLQGAYDSGYTFPDTFWKVEDGAVTGTAAKDEILSGLNYSVVIYSEEMDIEVPGKIVYASCDVTVTGKKTATNRTDGESDTAADTADDTDAAGDGIEVEEGSFEEDTDDSDPDSGQESSGAQEETIYTFVIYE